jgi:hypothetical protein
MRSLIRRPPAVILVAKLTGRRAVADGLALASTLGCGHDAPTHPLCKNCGPWRSAHQQSVQSRRAEGIAPGVRAPRRTFQSLSGFASAWLGACSTTTPFTASRSSVRWASTWIATASMTPRQRHSRRVSILRYWLLWIREVSRRDLGIPDTVQSSRGRSRLAHKLGTAA